MNKFDYILYIECKLLFIGFFFFFFGETNTHTQGRGKWVLTQKHTTTPLKSHGNFLRNGELFIGFWLCYIL